MANKIRLVICQLECHPAFYIDRTAFLEEPFVPDSEEDSLSNLGTFGIPGVIDLKTINKGTYLEWDRQRILQLISHPLLNEDITRIIVFPEGSISLENLLLLHEFSSRTNAIVVAGSHTIQRTVQANNIYKTLGKQKQLSKFNRQLGQVAFIFAGSKISAWKKRTLSPFGKGDGVEFRRFYFHLFDMVSGREGQLFLFTAYKIDRMPSSTLCRACCVAALR